MIKSIILGMALLRSSAAFGHAVGPAPVLTVKRIGGGCWIFVAACTAASLSLVFSIGVVFAGRWIGLV